MNEWHEPVVNLSLLPVALPVGIAVAGWVTTHILTLRAQRKGFQNQVLDRARTDITAKLRAYQSWLSQLSTWMRTLDFSKAALLAGITPNFREKADELLSLQERSKETREWSLALEDYQILFPETALARFRLDRRHLRILDAIRPVYSQLLSLSLAVPTATEVDTVFGVAKSGLSLVEDQSALLDDLRVHLQNQTLSRIMERKLSHRKPHDPTVPRLVPNERGSLEVVDASGQPLDDGGAMPEELAAQVLRTAHQ